MSVLKYGDITLDLIKVNNFERNSVYSKDGVDYLYTHFMVDITAIYNPGYNSAGWTAVESDVAIRKYLLAPRRPLLITLPSKIVVVGDNKAKVMGPKTAEPIGGTTSGATKDGGVFDFILPLLPKIAKTVASTAAQNVGYILAIQNISEGLIKDIDSLTTKKMGLVGASNPTGNSTQQANFQEFKSTGDSILAKQSSLDNQQRLLDDFIAKNGLEAFLVISDLNDTLGLPQPSVSNPVAKALAMSGAGLVLPDAYREAAAKISQAYWQGNNSLNAIINRSIRVAINTAQKAQAKEARALKNAAIKAAGDPMQVLLQSPVQGFTTDAKIGPLPIDCNVTKVLGNTTFIVQYRVETWVNEFNNFKALPDVIVNGKAIKINDAVQLTDLIKKAGAGQKIGNLNGAIAAICNRAILSNRWTMSHSRDQDGFIIRTTEGEAVFRRDIVTAFFSSLQPDMIRGQLFIAVPPLFRRKYRTAQSSDGCAIKYVLEDTQIPVAVNPVTTTGVQMPVARCEVNRRQVLGTAGDILSSVMNSTTSVLQNAANREFAKGNTGRDGSKHLEFRGSVEDLKKLLGK